MTANELKQIRLYRQHLTDRADRITVAKDLLGLQSQFTSMAYHSLIIRCNESLDVSNWGSGLVKTWTVRGTIHIISKEDLPLFKYNNEIYKSHEWESEMYGGTVWLSAKRKEFFAKLIVELVASGVGERDELRRRCRIAGMTDVEESYIFNGWGGLFRPLCERGFLTYTAQEKKEFAISPEYTPMGEKDAKLEMLRRYLEHFAPATIRDISYFFGYTQSEVKLLLNKLPVNTTSVEGAEHLFTGEIRTDYPDLPKCLFLAGFDQIMLGYRKEDSVFLPSKYIRGIFNLTGIVLPAVLLNGTVAGRWKKRGKKLFISCFRTFKSGEKRALESAARKTWKDALTIEYN